MIPYVMKHNSVTLLIDGRTYPVSNTHPNFQKVIDALREKRWDDILTLVDIPKAVNQYSKGLVTVTSDKVLYKDSELHGSLVDHLLVMFREGFDIDPLINFLTRLQNNPSYRAVNELYGFIQANDFTITPDGYFLAFKKVRNNFLDIHSGTMDNSVGKVLEVPRNQVDENSEATCSYGLHVCSEAYLPHFSSNEDDDRVVIVKVDPADVVAIPRDYNNAKMRVCKYEVVSEVKGYTESRTVPKLGAVNDSYDYEDEDEEDYDDDEWLEDSYEDIEDEYYVDDAARFLGITRNAVIKRANRGVTMEWVDRYRTIRHL